MAGDTSARVASSLLARVGADDEAHLASKLGTFICIFAAHCAVREWVSLYDVYRPQPLSEAAPRILPLALLFSLCFAGTLTERFRVPALYGLFVGLAYKFVEFAPVWSNHLAIEMVVSGFLLLGARSREGWAELCQALKWLVFISFFWAGLQKLLHGTYFDGTYLAFAAANHERFATFYAWILPAEEMQAIASLRYPGPYRFHSGLGLAVSNAVWIGEMGSALLLLSKRSRAFGIAGTLALVVAIELAARELMFGFLFLNLLLLYPARDWNRRVAPLFYVGYALVVANKWGVISLGAMN